MDKSKVSPQEIYEALEEQKKLLELKEKLSGLLNKVNHTMNSLAVENLQLTQSIDLSDTEEQGETKTQENSVTSPPEINYNQQEQSEIINQQMIEIDLKPRFNDEEIDTDEDNFY